MKRIDGTNGNAKLSTWQITKSNDHAVYILVTYVRLAIDDKAKSSTKQRIPLILWISFTTFEMENG